MSRLSQRGGAPGLGAQHPLVARSGLQPRIMGTAVSHPIMVVRSKKKQNERFGVRGNCTLMSAIGRKAAIQI